MRRHFSDFSQDPAVFRHLPLGVRLPPYFSVRIGSASDIGAGQGYEGTKKKFFFSANHVIFSLHRLILGYDEKVSLSRAVNFAIFFFQILYFWDPRLAIFRLSEGVLRDRENFDTCSE